MQHGTDKNTCTWAPTVRFFQERKGIPKSTTAGRIPKATQVGLDLMPLANRLFTRDNPSYLILREMSEQSRRESDVHGQRRAHERPQLKTTSNGINSFKNQKKPPAGSTPPHVLAFQKGEASKRCDVKQVHSFAARQRGTTDAHGGARVMESRV